MQVARLQIASSATARELAEQIKASFEQCVDDTNHRKFFARGASVLVVADPTIPNEHRLVLVDLPNLNNDSDPDAMLLVLRDVHRMIADSLELAAMM